MWSPLASDKGRKYRSQACELRLKVEDSLKQASRLLLLVVLKQVAENMEFVLLSFLALPPASRTVPLGVAKVYM